MGRNTGDGALIDDHLFPEQFNMADYFLDDRIEEGLGDKMACPLRRRAVHLLEKCSRWPIESATPCWGSVSRWKTAC